MSIAVFLTELFQQDIHLQLIEGKLKVDAPKGALTEEIKTELSARKQDILAYLAEQQRTAELPPLTQVDRQQPSFALSSAQTRLWFLQHWEPDSGQYNVNALFVLRSEDSERALDAGLQHLRRVFNALIAEHEALRTAFIAGPDGRPEARLLPDIELPLNEWQGTEAEYDDALVAAMRQPFDLAKPPLLRLTHFRLPGESRLLLTVHHIVVDHWSMQNLIELVLRKANDGDAALKHPTVPALQYIDYAHWQQQLLSDERYESLLGYWRETLGEADYRLDLPMQTPLAAADDPSTGERYHFTLPEADYAQLMALSQRYQVTPYVLLMAAYHWLLSRRTGQRDIRVASPMAERALPEFETMLGVFVNTVVIRAQLTPGTTAQDWLTQVNNAVQGAQRHSAMPFEKLVDELVSTRDQAHEPLAQTLFNYLRASEADTINIAGLQLQALPVPEISAKFALSLFALERQDSLSLSFQYRTDRYRAESIETLADYYLHTISTLLTALVDSPEAPLSQFPVLTEAEWQQQVSWNATAKPEYLPPRVAHSTLAAALSAQANATPEQPALAFMRHGQLVEWDYQILDRQVNQLANWLREQGVAPRSRIGISMPRGVQMVVSLLASVRAGCAYVPMDPEHPGSRLAHIHEQARPALTLTVPELLEEVNAFSGQTPVYALDAHFSQIADSPSTADGLPAVHPNDLAYIIFTSGSTGKPKGVAVPHIGVVNRLLWMQDAYPLTASDVVLQKTPYSFDVSVWEFFWPLIVGAKLVVAEPGDHQNPQKLAQLIEQYRVSTLHFVPTMLQAFLDFTADNPQPLSSLQRVFTSGEALPVAVKDRFLTRFNCQLHNLYGPTEASIDVTYWDCAQPAEGSVPIGYPIANMHTWILDADHNPVPVGVVGELYLSGPGLAQGYFDRDDLTEAAFIANPLLERLDLGEHRQWYQRLYRTGDLARWLGDGSIEYLGRTDFQVKIRGLRIELGDIETALQNLDFVKETVVLADQQTLVAYVVITGEEPDWQTWQDSLAGHLPAYMIPTVFIVLPKMPVNANGKTDRKALPAIDHTQHQHGAYTAPQTSNEVQLAEVFAEVLKLAQVSVDDNFFALGGDSILSLQVVTKARERGLLIEPKEVFKHASVKALAAVARTGQAKTFTADECFGQTRAAPIQQWFLDQPLANPNQFNQAILLATGETMDTDALRAALWHLLQAHPILCAQFCTAEGQWQQHIPNPTDISTDEVCLTEQNWQASTEKEVQSQIDVLCEHEQAQLSIAEGALFRAALVRIEGPETNTATTRLLLVAHHLVIDAVSWRILLDTLNTAYQAALKAQPLPAVAPKTLPYKGWADAIAEQCERSSQRWDEWAQHPEVTQALAVQYPLATAPLLPEQPLGISATERFTLSREATDTLLRQVGQAVNANAEDLCLSALAQALKQWTGQPDHLIQLEGHGRDQIEADLSQSIGWFTRIYPALISAPLMADTASDWRTNLLATRAALSGLPENQQPFLTVTSNLSQRLQPPLVFNYLGQLDMPTGAAEGERAWLRKAPETLSAFRDVQNPRHWPIEVNAFVQNRQLTVNLQYARQWLNAEQAQTLANAFQQSLQSLCAAGPLPTGAVAADYPMANISDAQTLRVVDALSQQGQSLEDLYTLSPAQQGMYFYCLDHPQGYISQSLVNCLGELDLTHFRQAWRNSVARHCALRTRFIVDDVDEPHQAVLAEAPLVFETHDWSGLSAEAIDEQLTQLQQHERQQLNLEQAPLMRLALVNLPNADNGEPQTKLVWTIHHLIMDGWCLQQLVGEVMNDYRHLCAGKSDSSAAPATAYRAFIDWLNQQTNKADAEAYWRESLRGFTEASALPKWAVERPTEFEQPVKQRRNNRFFSQALGAQASAALASWAKAQGLTQNSVIQGLWGLVMSRYLATDDLVIGVTTSGRPADLPGAERIMGVFINTLPLRLRIDPAATMTDWLQAVQATNVEMREFEQTPLAAIQRWSEVSGNGPLFNSLLVFENLPISDATPIDGLTLSLENHSVQNNFPLTLRVVPKANLQFDLLMAPEQVDPAIVEEMVQGLVVCISALTQDTSSAQQTLGQLIHHWLDDTASSVPPMPEDNALTRLHSLNPTAIALEVADANAAHLAQCDYATLLHEARLMAASLPAFSHPNPVIAVCLPRQREQIIAMLAAWYRGAAWLCLDPEQPQGRIEAILADAEPVVVICEDTPAWVTSDASSSNAWRTLESLAAATSSNMIVAAQTLAAQQTAYLMYTSGSTGAPKAVQISHANLISYVDALFERVDIAPAASMTTLASVAADLGLTAVFGALLSGRTLRLLPAQHYFDPETLAEQLARHPVDVLKIAPPHLNALMAVAQPERLLPRDCLILGGDAMSAELLNRLRQLAPDMRILNHYGPTETTIGCCAGWIENEHGVRTIGPPLMNSIGYVVDEKGLPVADGVAGELWIAGVGVAQGYLNKPEATAQSFSQTDGWPLHKTGDRVARQTDGSLVYLGRQDDQVKIRGFRVELSEVAAVLNALPAVKTAQVIAVPAPAGQQLAAVVVPASAITPAALEAELVNQLPEYMVPRQWALVDTLPMTKNGKIDRQALVELVSKKAKPEPAAASASAPQDVSKETDLHSLLTELWQQLLQQDVGPNDNFFSLGGDSIIALQLVAKLRQHGVKLTPKQLYAAPTVAELAQQLAQQLAGDSASPDSATAIAVPGDATNKPDSKPAEYALLPIQHWFFEVPQPKPHHWNQAILLHLPEQINHVAMTNAVQAVLQKHPILTARFRGLGQQETLNYQHSGETAAVYAGFDHLDDAALNTLYAATQQSLNLSHGPVFKVLAANRPEGDARLLLVAHHLVVDGVSWRIIGRDLHQAYQALLQGQTPDLGEEITTAEQWQQSLLTLPESKLAAARHYWQPMVNQFADGLLLPGAIPGTVGQAHSETQTLSAELTERLLALGNRHQRSACEAAMLGALTQAIAEQFPRSQWLLEMESHGRAEIQQGQDLSDTVGWLTSRFPVRLNTADTSIDAVTKALSEVPDLGIGYGVLRYLEQSLAFPAPQVLFNYLGQTRVQDSDWALISGAGQARHPDSIRRQLIDVVAEVRDGVLTVHWQYPPDLKPTLGPLIEQFARELTARAESAATLAMPDYPLTPVQQGMYLHGAGHGAMYFNQTAVALSGELQTDPFIAAWQATVNAEQALKAAFIEQDDGTVRQRFAEQVTLPVETLDWSGLSAQEQQRKLQVYCQQDRARGFARHQAPLMRLALIRIDHQTHWLVWSRHHLIVDAWCSGLVVHDVMARYRQRLGDNTIMIAPRPNFSDYLEWMEQQDMNASHTFWKAYLAGYDTPLALPAGEAGQPYKLFEQTLSSEITKALKDGCRRHGVTLNALVQVAWGMALAYHSGQKEIVFGMTTSGRPEALPQAQRMVGIFINSVPVRLSLTPKTTLSALLTQVHQQGVLLREHDRLPLVEIASYSDLPPGQALFDTLVVFENEALSATNGPSAANGLSITPLHAYERTNYPITLTVMPHDTTRLRLACDGEKVSLTMAEQLLASLATVLIAFVHHQEEVSLSRFCREAFGPPHAMHGPVVDLNGWNLGRGLLADWSQKQDRIAVQDDVASLTYHELITQALSLANALRQRGVTPESRIAIFHPRRNNLLVALLGVYAAGASYVPLDPHQPEQRLAMILEEAQPDWVLTDGTRSLGDAQRNLSVAELVQSGAVTEAEHEAGLASLQEADNGLAYTIFTSGSTGRPKGVQISRFALNNFLYSMNESLKLQAHDRLLAVTTVGFDIAVLELFVPLLAGARVVIADEDQVRDGAALNDCLMQQRISVMQATPMTWQMLIDQGEQNWQHLNALVGGEALPPALAQAILARGARLTNLYGPTETTIWSSSAVITLDNASAPSLGEPITNTQLYLLDDWQNPVALGAEGELYIAGDGVAEGYLNRPDLTEQVFLPDPFATSKTARMYKTGDKVRRSLSGELTYLGRADFQIKLRGYRIETGEIEARLSELPGVKEAVVTLCFAGTEQAALVAYLTGTPSSAEDFRAQLKAVLPSYMVPAHIVVLAAMPLNANNKIDRKALTQGDFLKEITFAKRQAVPPQGETETAIAQVWQGLLHVDTVWREDDFFALGGNSLMAGRMIARLRREYGFEIPLVKVFRHSVLEDLATLINKQSKNSNEIAVSAETFNPLLPMNAKASAHQAPQDAVFVLHPAGGIVRAYQTMVAEFDDRFPVYGLESPQLHMENPEQETIDSLAERYIERIRTVQATGPYRFIGWSFGAWLAMAMTKKLEAQGERIDWVAIVDARADIANAQLKAPGLMQVCHFLTCLDHQRREWLLNHQREALLSIEAHLATLDDAKEKDEFAFNGIAKLFSAQEGRLAIEGDRNVRFLQMKLLMNSHKLMKSHRLESVNAPMHVFWSAQTLTDIPYQNAAQLGEWNGYGTTEEIKVDGDHESIVRDASVAKRILALIER